MFGDYYIFFFIDQRDDVLYGFLNIYVFLEKVRVGDYVFGDYFYQGQFLEALDFFLFQVGELQLFIFFASSFFFDGFFYYFGDGYVYFIRYNLYFGGVSCLEDVRILLM